MTYGTGTVGTVSAAATSLISAGAMDSGAQQYVVVTGTTAADVTIDYYTAEVLKK